MPPGVVARLTEAVAAPELRERFAAVGVDAASSSPGELAELVRTEMGMWARVARLTGARSE